jgi:hypothetical protein
VAWVSSGLSLTPTHAIQKKCTITRLN